MSRLIDADDLEIYRERFDTYNDYSMVLDMIDDSPTVDVEPQWIPVDKRLPKEEGYYLVTMMSINTNERWVAQCRFFKDERYEGFLTIIEKVVRVIAWMPSPESYKGVVMDNG